MSAVEQVNTKWRRYPDCAQAGEDWFGQVPADWSVVSLKRLFRIVNGATPSTSEPACWDGNVVWVTPDDLGQNVDVAIADSGRRITAEGLRSCAASVVPAGSLVISTRAPIGYVGLAQVDLCTNQGCRSLVPLRGLASRYYVYLLQTARPYLQALGTGSTFMELSGAQLGAVPVPLPSLAEQRAIAEFLDRETGRIDALIEKKRRLIELLEEKRTALITRAVTKGLDPDAPLKPSGVEWLGDIPEHWEVTKLQHLTPDDRPIRYGIVLPGPDVPEGVPLVKGGDVDAGRLRPDSLAKVAYDVEVNHPKSRLNPGDLLYAIRGSIGEVEMVPELLAGANITQDVARVSPMPEVNGHWLLHVLRSTAVFCQLQAGTLGAAVMGVNIRDLRRAMVAVPPSDEQVQIADHMNTVSENIDRLRALSNEAITKLQEYRTALISAAVTGKIDVRNT